MANILSKDLRDAVLQAAVQGKLTEQLESDGNASDLLKQIKEEKEQLIKDKKIKKEKELGPISDEDKPFNIPENWEWVRLGEACETNIGLTYKPSDVTNDNITGTLVLRSSNIQNGKMCYDDNVFVKCNIPESSYINKGDILICVRNGSRKLVGKSAIVDKNNMAFGAFMAKVHGGYINNKYIQYYIESHVFRGALDNVGTETINQITQSMLKNSLFPLPPLAEQKRIVERVDALMKEIDELEKIEIELENLKQQFPIDLKASLLQAAMQGKLTEQLPTDSSVDDLIEQIKLERKKLEDEGKIKKTSSKSGLTNSLDKGEYPFEIPDNWKFLELQNFCIVSSGGTPSRSNSEYWESGNIPWLKIDDMTDKYIKSTKEFITQKGVDNSSAKICDKNTLVYSIFASIGKVGILEEEMTTNQAIANIKPLAMDIEYMYYILLALKNVLIKQGRGCAQLNINQQILKSTLIPIPPIEEQQRIVEQLNKLLPMCED